MSGPAEPEAETEVDQEFEDACRALAMTETPELVTPRSPWPDVHELGIEDPGVVSAAASSPAPVAPPFARSFGVAAAGDLAEPEPEPESDVEITAQDLVPIPAEVAPPTYAPTYTPAFDLEQPSDLDRSTDPAQPSGDDHELAEARAELAATRTELESLRADFQAERFRSRDERLRLEGELASVRRPTGPAEGHLESNAQTEALRREIELLREELADLRSRHADEVDRLESDVRAAQAREAQTVIAAQLAEDELKAVRSEAVAAKAAATDFVAVRSEAETLQRRVEELQQQLQSLGSTLSETEKDLRISRETAGERIRQIELQLASREAELATTQQELLDSEGRRADEAASFLAALHRQG